MTFGEQTNPNGNEADRSADSDHVIRFVAVLEYRVDELMPSINPGLQLISEDEIQSYTGEARRNEHEYIMRIESNNATVGQALVDDFRDYLDRTNSRRQKDDAVPYLESIMQL